MKYLFFAFSFFFSNLALASGVENWLKYSNPGDMKNITAPQIIENQAGGLITGGSVIIRGPIPQDLSPIHIQMPNFKFDPCSGSGDFRFGAISYISGEEFVRFFKNLVRASGGYAAKLFLKTACPQCEDIMSQFEAIVRDINGVSMNQCALAQNVVDGTFGKMLAGSRLGCMIKSNASNQNQDLFATTSKCQDNPREYNNLAVEETKNMLPEEFNLVWRALKRDGNLQDNEFFELLMSISGTIIAKNNNHNNLSLIHRPSLFTEDQIENYVGNKYQPGSIINIYTCDEPSKCLNTLVKANRVEEKDNFHRKIYQLLVQIMKKIRLDSPQLTEDEESLISFSSIPVLVMLEQELVSKQGQGGTIETELIDVICYDMVVGFLDSLLSKVETEVKNLEMAQLERSIFENFFKGVDSTRTLFYEKKMTAYQRANLVTQAKERMQLLKSVQKENYSKVLHYIGKEL